MSKMNADAVELTSQLSLQQIVNGLRQAANDLRADVEEVESDALDKFSASPDVQVVFSGAVGFLGGLKHFRPGSANNSWAVQVYVTDLGSQRHIELIALGESVFAGGLGNGMGVLNMGASIEKRDALANYIVG